MSYSGDAAEQVVRMTLESGEAAVKLAGAGAKQVAVLLYAILRDQKKTQGKMRLTNLLRSGKELKVFAVKDGDLALFCKEAKKYGVLYTVLKDRDAADGITDIMVRAEDAAKINRIFERFDLATVDLGSVKQEIEQSKAGPAQAEQEKEDFLDALLAPAPEETANPTPRTEASPPSAPISARSAARTADRPSVRRELREIQAAQRQRVVEHRTPPQKKHEKGRERA